ncbi:MAG: indole-3-glycerol-phosphate synthase TrpC [Candidatus Omnitrophota bacterium]|nr:MAG: indole-3-glycerol-phosphate synthase TrpC [Candidatus Omnitrophota bacterium]
MSKDVLKEIVLKKKEKILIAKQQLPEELLTVKVKDLAPARAFIAALNKPRQITLIAEIKKQSPSAGLLREDFNPVEIAKAYQEAGAHAVSVLTEEDNFSGDINYINQVKAAVNLPILRKDFILQPYQIYESRYFGADAVLLIADILTKEQLTQLIQLADSLGLDSLVEVHTEKELKKILSLKIAPLAAGPEPEGAIKKSKDKEKKFIDFAIGINNRDLHTLEVDPKITEKLYILIPKERTVVVESGLKSSQDVLFLKILGVNAVLIGSAFMQAPDIIAKVHEMMGW